MLTNDFYLTLCSALMENVGSSFFLAIGRGDTAWDEIPPQYDRSSHQMVNEVARHAVTANDTSYIDDAGITTRRVTHRLRIQTAFAAGEATGSLRECGLFGGAASSELNSGTLISYFMHRRLDKSEQMSLNRSIIVDLRPRASGPGQIVTRYLGNSSTRELHDLDNRTGACQVDEIRIDNRIYFGSPLQAAELGYDHCAFCFGREASRR